MCNFFFLFLFQHGVSLYIQDKEGLSALDLIMKDRPRHVVFKNTGKKIPQIEYIKVQLWKLSWHFIFSKIAEIYFVWIVTLECFGWRFWFYQKHFAFSSCSLIFLSIKIQAERVRQSCIYFNSNVHPESNISIWSRRKNKWKWLFYSYILISFSL